MMQTSCSSIFNLVNAETRQAAQDLRRASLIQGLASLLMIAGVALAGVVTWWTVREELSPLLAVAVGVGGALGMAIGVFFLDRSRAPEWEGHIEATADNARAGRRWAMLLIGLGILLATIIAVYRIARRMQANGEVSLLVVVLGSLLLLLVELAVPVGPSLLAAIADRTRRAALARFRRRRDLLHRLRTEPESAIAILASECSITEAERAAVESERQREQDRCDRDLVGASPLRLRLVSDRACFLREWTDSLSRMRSSQGEDGDGTPSAPSTDLEGARPVRRPVLLGEPVSQAADEEEGRIHLNGSEAAVTHR